MNYDVQIYVLIHENGTTQTIPNIRAKTELNFETKIWSKYPLFLRFLKAIVLDISAQRKYVRAYWGEDAVEGGDV